MKTSARFLIAFCPRALLFARLWLGCLLFVAALPSGHAANTFGSAGSLANGRQSHTATLLHDGRVLIAGGHDSFNPVALAELYDPAAGFATGTALATPRYAHTATLLPNGKVLLVGGYNSSGNVIASAELYNPGPGTGTGSLATGRAFHTAVLLGNGKVLVCGGTNGGGPLASAQLYDPATGTWSATGALATARQAHTATLLPNGKVLAVGGADGFGTFFSSVELYDPVAGTWSATGFLGTARGFHTATLLPNGRVLAVGGQTNGFGAVASAQSYDPATGAWTDTVPLATARYGHSATLLPNGNVLVAFGQTTGGGFLGSGQLYDFNTGSWSAAANESSTRAYHTATVMHNGTVLLAGGAWTGGGTNIFADLFDPRTGGWTEIGDLINRRAYANHTSTLLPDGRVLIAGGFNPNPPSNYLAAAELYDPAADAWIATGALANARGYHTGTLLPSGKVLVAGGYNGSVYFASAELYNPATGTWSATGGLALARAEHTATLLSNGKVLVAGGGEGGPYIAAELYDPASSVWTVTGNLTTPRFHHSATLLPNGKVLVVGGFYYDPNPHNLNTAELYDPATGEWSPASSLTRTRVDHTATLLPNGKVLVVGGSGSSNLAELYNPATNSWSDAGYVFVLRERHSATLLPGREVILAGGSQYTLTEIYDPATGYWGYASGLVSARDFQTTELLLNGKVLLAGGSPYTSKAALYDPGLGFLPSWQPQISSAFFDSAGRLVLTGTRFRGISSASGGNGGQDSPTNHPLVQLRRLDNEQTVFLLPDSSVPVTATGFTSTPVAPFLGRAMVTVFVNGIPSTSVIVAFADIVVERPAGTIIADGGSKDIGAMVAGGAAANAVFTIKNIGAGNLVGLAITKDGANAADFTISSGPAATVLPGASTTFTIQFASATVGTKTAAIHIANNVVGKNPYDITLTAHALSFTQDTDGDGLNDASELEFAAFGFDWQVSQPSLVNTLYSKANGAGLFTTAQVQALNIDVPLIQRNPANGTFKLTIGVQKSTNLLNFAPFPMNAPGTSTVINGSGKLEFQFTVPDNAAFFRLEAQ